MQQIELVTEAAARVFEELGYGCLESCYQYALEIELRDNFSCDVQIFPQYTIRVFYKNSCVGTGIADFIIYSKTEQTLLIVELKTAKAMSTLNQGLHQALAYRRALERNPVFGKVCINVLVIGVMPDKLVTEYRLSNNDPEIEIVLAP